MLFEELLHALAPFGFQALVVAELRGAHFPGLRQGLGGGQGVRHGEQALAGHPPPGRLQVFPQCLCFRREGKGEVKRHD